MSDEAKAVRLKKFKSFYAIIRDKVIDHFADKGMPPDAVEWYRRNWDYSVPTGKSTRGMFIVDAITILKNRPLSDDEYFQAAVLGWCGELYQAFCLIADDIMDYSITRRGKPCWYCNDNVGMRAINDSFMLHAAIYHLLKVHFRSEPYYVDIVDLFQEVIYLTGMGQLVDLITAPIGEVELGRFTFERQQLIIKYKTAHSYYLPVALALHITATPGTDLTPKLDLAKSILLPLGSYFQIQDDYLDFAASPEHLGKIGTDIVDNKCSWCIVTAMRLASPKQRNILEENYGRHDLECENRVKKVFEDVGLRREFEAYEEEFVRDIRERIQSAGEGEMEGRLMREVFERFLGVIYKRSK